jgi:hypothetical protein
MGIEEGGRTDKLIFNVACTVKNNQFLCQAHHIPMHPPASISWHKQGHILTFWGSTKAFDLNLILAPFQGPKKDGPLLKMAMYEEDI